MKESSAFPSLQQSELLHYAVALDQCLHYGVDINLRLEFHHGNNLETTISTIHVHNTISRKVRIAC